MTNDVHTLEPEIAPQDFSKSERVTELELTEQTNERSDSDRHLPEPLVIIENISPEIGTLDQSIEIKRGSLTHIVSPSSEQNFESPRRNIHSMADNDFVVSSQKKYQLPVDFDYRNKAGENFVKLHTNMKKSV